MSESNNNTDLPNVIQLPKPELGQSLREAYEEQLVYEERLSRIRDKIVYIKKLLEENERLRHE